MSADAWAEAGAERHHEAGDLPALKDHGWRGDPMTAASSFRMNATCLAPNPVGSIAHDETRDCALENPACRPQKANVDQRRSAVAIRTRIGAEHNILVRA